MTINMNTIQKHYDKLTARERFALIVQAAARDDIRDEDALVDSAPKINFEFPHTHGLTMGFRQLVKMHMIQQLGRSATFFMLVGFNDDEHVFKTTNQGEPVMIGDAIELTAMRFMEGLEAFAVICKEYNVDSEVMQAGYGFDHVLQFAEISIRAWYGEDYSTALLTDLENTIAEHRSVIEDARKRWAEAQAK